MMSHKEWSEADIFAYLDGGLSAAKRAALESQCSHDAKLRQRVKQAGQVLNVTQDLMQVVPLRESPRNYLLTPEMVAEPVKRQTRASSPSMLWMRLATAATAAAFVITMGLNLMVRGMLPYGPLP
ncbi:MAG: hypothetical protein JW981_08320, partial [Anaerolineae bacterium]|nr:hypothetical protein [Anaerolineae bacterium]